MLLQLEALHRSGQYKEGQIPGSVAKQTQRLVFGLSFRVHCQYPKSETILMPKLVRNQFMLKC